jgi:diguanylate cyclase (GGDEF)-like protein
MTTLRVLLVEGNRKTSDGVERSLRRDLPRSTRIVRARRIPDRVEGFDVAVVVTAGPPAHAKRIPKLPTVIVSPDACAGDSVALSKRGVAHGLSATCATCPRQPSLASTLNWVMQSARRFRDLERAQELDHRNALHDGLTGLANVHLCRERLRQLLAQARRKKKHVAVLYLDLDRFKEVNDQLGHAIGDRLLQAVAARLRSCTRETDTVARRGGDEFVILLDDVRGAGEAACVAREIASCLCEPCCVQGTVVRPSASIGVAVFPEDGEDGETLERQADLAMYAGKRSGGNRVQLAADLRKMTSAKATSAAHQRLTRHRS